MTPAETYAQKRLEAVALIQKHAPTRLQDALIELLRPAIALSATRTEEAQIPIGASKFGGAPDVPSGFEWPTWNDKPLGFLAQINLEEVAAFDVEELLPKSGLLSFFIDIDAENPIYPEQEERWKIFLHENQLLDRLIPPSQTALKPCSVRIRASCSLPTICEDEVSVQFGEDQDEELNRFLEFCDEFYGSVIYPAHHLLGWPYTLQTSPEGDWQLLFQIDSQVEMTEGEDYFWGDPFIYCFWIDPQELRVAKFSNVWLDLQCS